MIEPARGQLQLTVTGDPSDQPTSMTLHCVPVDAIPCTSLRLVSLEQILVPDTVPVTLMRGE